MNTLSILFIILVFTLDSCSTTKSLAYNLESSEVTDLFYFEPISNIYLIGQGNIGIYNDSLSDNSKRFLNKIVHDFKSNISLSGTIILTNSALKLRLNKEIEHLYLTAENIKSISNIKITPVIDSLLESNNKRFGLITVASGYTRTQSNYAAHQTMHEIGTAAHILTNGIFPFFLPRATEASSSTLSVMIVNADQNNITFYRKSVSAGDPDDENMLIHQFKKIFEGYFF